MILMLLYMPVLWQLCPLCVAHLKENCARCCDIVRSFATVSELLDTEFDHNVSRRSINFRAPVSSFFGSTSLLGFPCIHIVGNLTSKFQLVPAVSCVFYSYKWNLETKQGT